MSKSSVTFIKYFCTLAALFLLGCLLYSCGHPTEADARLDVAEKLMEEAPDSSLTLLEQIDTTALTGDSRKARYALLKTQAMDRNYVDTTTFDILQPALDYYLHKGTAAQKLKALYYKARIYQNRQEEDSAMFTLLQAKEFIPTSTDTLMNARMLANLASAQYNICEIQGCLKGYLAAADLFGKCHNPDNEVWNLSNALMACYILKDKHTADSIREIAKPLLAAYPDLEDIYHPSDLRYDYFFGSEEDKRATLIGPEGVDSISDDTKLYMSNLYCEMGDAETGKLFFDAIDPESPVTETPEYISLKPFVYETNHDYKEALEYYQNLIQHFDSTYNRLITKNLLFADQKYELEKKRDASQRSSSQIISLLILFCFLILILVIILILRNRIKAARIKLEEEKNQRLITENREKELEAENLELRINQLESEAEQLKNTLQENQELSEQVRKALKERLEALNELLVHGWNSSTGAKSDLVKNLLQEIDKFQDQTLWAFKGSHPGFIKTLEEKHLTDAEVKYICMYAIGFNAKEIGDLLNIKRPYHYSSLIREKLGIASSKEQLNTYIRRLLRES